MTELARDPDRLYKLMPALYRIADEQQGGELRALLRLINVQADALRDDTQQLWDDFFVETAQRWAIPYIGALVGNAPLHDLDLQSAAATAEGLFADLAGGADLRPSNPIRLRADVARTIYYRRRKGTVPMLEGLARDVTGWGAHAVEFFTRLDWNQHLEHLRLDCAGCPDLRDAGLRSRSGGPWDTASHTVDVRRINNWNGWYNIANIGFFLWRLRAFPLEKVTPRAIGGTAWRCTFSPLGQDIALFSAGESELGASGVAAPVNAQDAIDNCAFSKSVGDYYGTGDGASLVLFDGANAIDGVHIKVANLAQWTAITTQPIGLDILVDAQRGRMVVPDGYPNGVTASYHYGFSAAMGGGDYERAKWLVPPPVAPGAFVQVSGGGLNLQNAINALTGTDNVIEIGDDATYEINQAIALAAGEWLTIQAANTCRPHVHLAGGAVDITGGGYVAAHDRRASLTLGGLLVEGGLHVLAEMELLRLLHTTLVPGRSVLQEALPPPDITSVAVDPAADATHLQVQIAFSITGRLTIPDDAERLVVLDSIVADVDANAPVAVSDTAGTSGPPAHIERSTIRGKTFFLKLDMASESIFTDLVSVGQRQAGCVRFSYVPRGSQTPQQYRCQPAFEIAQQDASQAAQIAQWLVPDFETTQYDRPAYMQLRLTCPLQIRGGAEDGSEMGAFCTLKQTQREANLRLRLDEYLPVGLEAGIIYVT